mmetsp:Transcript_9227/g.21935  ORF Transcript_9227/g.21935 Transcript_9227/m.21935 type:complete len:205 (+) Transcript_9227:394-1008(+)
MMPSVSQGSDPEEELSEGDAGAGCSFCLLDSSCSIRMRSTALSLCFLVSCASFVVSCVSKACARAFFLTAASVTSFTGGFAGADDEDADPAAMLKEIGASPSLRWSSVNSDSWKPPSFLHSAMAFFKAMSCLCSEETSPSSFALAAAARIRASGELSTNCRYQPFGVLSMVHWFVLPRYWTKLLRVTQMVEFICVWCRLEIKSQ